MGNDSCPRASLIVNRGSIGVSLFFSRQDIGRGRGAGVDGEENAVLVVLMREESDDVLRQLVKLAACPSLPRPKQAWESKSVGTRN